MAEPSRPWVQAGGRAILEGLKSRPGFGVFLEVVLRLFLECFLCLEVVLVSFCCVF